MVLEWVILMFLFLGVVGFSVPMIVFDQVLWGIGAGIFAVLFLIWGIVVVELDRREHPLGQ